ncbi:hypothetical protein ACFUV2_23435 [Streptomyces pilosus]|uniref:hypothetical protein n=2 Tax=Streptomyces pilosus TaxID=28893 RepID=UPI00198D26CF|nr:hypothetical protein [Streptomyces pilosus]GGV61765.1 hypothetical protein GCM10010261_50750 [Streptomyces pilosus]
MSTEARRASLPPRPAVPPRPAHPPAPQSRTSGGPGAFDTREPAHDAAAPSDGPAPAPGGGTAGPGERTGTGPTPPPATGPEAAGRDGAAPAAAPPGWPPRTPGSGGAGPSRPSTGGTGPAGPGGPGAAAHPSAGGASGTGPEGRRGAAGTAPGDGDRRTEEAATGRRGGTTDASRAGLRAFEAGAPGPVGPPPPPRASARFPDAPPSVGRGLRSPDAPPSVGRGLRSPDAPPAVPPQPTHRPAARGAGAPPETASETTTRLRPVPAHPAHPVDRPGTPPMTTPGPRPGDGGQRRAGTAAGTGGTPPGGAPDPALSWSAPMAPGGVPGPARPAVVSFGEPEGYDGNARPRPLGRRSRSQLVAAAACFVLGTGLISGAVTGSWLTDGSEGTGTRSGFAAAGALWHNVPVDQLFPPTLQGKGAGPGNADRTWTRIAVAPDSGCKGAFDPLLRKVLDPVGCARLLRATYTDATQSHVTTVGLLFTEADAAGMSALARRFGTERLDRRTDLVPLPYAAKGTAAEGFGPGQRASWAISVLTDAPVVVYAVTGWADGRTAGPPQPARDAVESTAGTGPAQAGLGHEARGLADRIERGLRKKAGTATERPS